MSQKFFTLIHGDQLHISPETKVVSKEAFSKLQNADEMLQTVQDDMEKFRQEVAAEGEALKEQKSQEGFEKGYSEWSEKLAELEAEIHSVREEMQKAIVPVAVEAAKKIVGRELKSSKETVVDIVYTALKAIAQHKKVIIWINKNDLETLEKSKKKLLSLFENIESLSIRPRDDITENGCIIETEKGIINAQLENQWLILENAFTKLLKETAKP